MKSKKIIYILLPATIFVWGWVIFRVISNVNKNRGSSTSAQIIEDDWLLLNDSFQYKLMSDYTDPFLRSRTVKTRKSIPTVLQGVKQDLKPRRDFSQPLKWPHIQYHGQVRNHAEYDKIGILTVNSKNYLVSPKDTVDDLAILFVGEDSLKVSYSGEQKTFLKK